MRKNMYDDKLWFFIMRIEKYFDSQLQFKCGLFISLGF